MNVWKTVLLVVLASIPPVRASTPEPRDLPGLVPVSLEGLRNHDLLDGKVAPMLTLAERLPLPSTIPLALDASAAPDAVLLRAGSAPRVPAEVRVPLGRPARTAYVLTACQGPLDVRDIVAEGELVYADGRTQPLKWMVGEHAWPAWAGATGRAAEAVSLGRNPSGDVLTASLLTVDVAFPEVPLRELVIRSRPGPLAFALLAVTLGGGPPLTPQGSADRELLRDSYPFEVRKLPGLAFAPIEAGLQAREGRLRLPDGTPWRGVGINLVGKGALPPVGEEDAWAERIANLGFQVARLHHLDVEGPDLLMNPARGTKDPDGKPAPGFRPEGLDRLDRFVAALARRGVRVVLEGWTLRSFRPGEGVTAPEGVPLGNKSAAFYLEDWEEARKAHFRGLWDRVNPYRGIRYAQDPAVAWVEVANEDSLLVQWASGSLDRLPGAHRTALDRRWNAWLRARYGDDARLTAAWTGRMRGGLQAGESVELDSVAREPTARNRTELWPLARAADLARFYRDLEEGHHARLAKFIREDLGFQAPRVCNTSFGVPLAEATVGACEIVDLHLYWDPPPEQQVFTDRPLLGAPLQNRFLEKIAWCQEGKACAVSELDHTFPARHGQEAPLLWAAVAARQGWDALLWFAWSHGPIREGAAPEGSHDLQGRANVLAQLPAVRALFSQGAIEPAPRRFVRWWSTNALLRDLAEPPGLWLDPHAASWGALSRRLRASFAELPPPLDAPGPEATSPVRWDVERSRLAIDTPRGWAVVGEGSLQAGGLRVEVDRFAAVSLVSLEAATLDTGARALLTAVGRAEREGTLWGDGPSLRAWGRGPVRLEGLSGTVTFRWPRRPEALVLDGEAEPTGSIPVERAGRGLWRLRLDGLRSPWVEIR